MFSDPDGQCPITAIVLVLKAALIAAKFAIKKVGAMIVKKFGVKMATKGTKKALVTTTKKGVVKHHGHSIYPG